MGVREVAMLSKAIQEGFKTLGIAIMYAADTYYETEKNKKQGPDASFWKRDSSEGPA